MKNEIKHIMCDVDQTLLKPNGELQQGCTTLMQKVFESNIPVTFISGKNMSEMFGFFDTLCKKSGIDPKEFKVSFASNVGAYARTRSGSYESNPISEEDIRQIEEIVSGITKSSVIVYKTRSNNYMESLLDSKHKIKKFITSSVVKALDEIGKVDFPISAKRREYIDVLLRDRQVLSLEVVCARRSKEVALALSEKFPNLVVCQGDAVQVSCMGKKAYIEQYVINENLDWQNICVLGDALNDREALLKAGYGLVCNPKKKRLDFVKEVIGLQEKGIHKYVTSNLGSPNVINYVTGKEYNEAALKRISKDVMKELEPQQRQTRK